MIAPEESSRDNNRWMVQLCYGLDGFKAINDTLGHAQGDYLLQIVAPRLQNCVRMSDSVAHWVGMIFCGHRKLIDARNPSLVAEKI